MTIKTLVLIAIASVGFAASAALAQANLNRPSSQAVPPTGCMSSRPASHMGMGMMQDMQVSSEFDYLSQMIPHHQEAIDTARQVLARSNRPEMKQFAQSIIDVQSAEIEQMQDWLKVWYPGRSSTHSYTPMMRDLSPLSGNELDRAFLEDMITHHMGAVMMSQMLLNHTLVEHQAIEPFAERISSSQRQEIAQMRTWLRTWYGVAIQPRRMHYGMGQWLER
ncbi:MAG TPA: DUF305 domain-containing protein [Crinalium sp.]|jgi:uncharacterized protein (DUF305 family)